jgi:hypothetical protein
MRETPRACTKADGRDSTPPFVRYPAARAAPGMAVSSSANADVPPHPYRAASIVVTAVILSRSAEIRWRHPQRPKVRSPASNRRRGAAPLVQGSSRRLWRNRLGGRGGKGCQHAMTRAHSRACTLSVMPGNSRRNSIAADNSPCCSNVARIAAASASVTTNMQEAW